MANQENLHSQTQGSTSQFLSIPVSAGKRIMNNWTFWHIEHGFAMGLAPANPWPSCHRPPEQGREVWCLATQLSSNYQTSAAPKTEKAHRSHRKVHECSWFHAPCFCRSKHVHDTVEHFRKSLGLLVISKECWLAEKPTPPIGHPLFRRSVDPDDSPWKVCSQPKYHRHLHGLHSELSEEQDCDSPALRGPGARKTNMKQLAVASNTWICTATWWHWALGTSLCRRSSCLSLIGDQGFTLGGIGSSQFLCAAHVKRWWTQFCQGADAGKAISLWSSFSLRRWWSVTPATRINEAVEGFWASFGMFQPRSLELTWMGSGFRAVVPSSGECNP